MNEQLSPNSLILAGKSLHGDEAVFLRVLVKRNCLEHLRTSSDIIGRLAHSFSQSCNTALLIESHGLYLLNFTHTVAIFG